MHHLTSVAQPLDRIAEQVLSLLDHALDQVFLGVDVAVQRHRLDPELPAEPAHGEGVDPLAVDQVQGGAQHPPA